MLLLPRLLDCLCGPPLPPMLSGSPLTWWSRLPSRAPLITPINPDCTLWLGMLRRQELPERVLNRHAQALSC